MVEKLKTRPAQKKRGLLVLLRDRHGFGGGKRLFDQPFNIKARLFAFHFCKIGADERMLRQKDRAAILIRQDRRIIGPDPAGNFYDLRFIQPYERAKHRQAFDDGFGGGDPLDRLAGDLPQTFPRNDTLRTVPLCRALGDPHHKAAQQRDHHLRRAKPVYLLLDMRNADHMQLQPAGILRKNARQLLHLFARLQIGIRITVSFYYIE